MCIVCVFCFYNGQGIERMAFKYEGIFGFSADNQVYLKGSRLTPAGRANKGSQVKIALWGSSLSTPCRDKTNRKCTSFYSIEAGPREAFWLE